MGRIVELAFSRLRLAAFRLPNWTKRRTYRASYGDGESQQRLPEGGVMPSRKLLAEMGKFNQELMNAGVFLGADGLHASSKGKRVRFIRIRS
jgi:hypothetical protein